MVPVSITRKLSDPSRNAEQYVPSDIAYYVPEHSGKYGATKPRWYPAAGSRALSIARAKQEPGLCHSLAVRYLK